MFKYPELLGLAAALLGFLTWRVASSVTGVTDVRHDGYLPVIALTLLSLVPAVLLGLAARWWANRAERKRG